MKLFELTPGELRLRRIENGVLGWVGIPICILLPIFLVFFSGIPNWLGRLISVVLAGSFLLITMVYWALRPWPKPIEGTTGNQKKKIKRIKVVQFFLPIFFIGLASSTFFVFFPFFKNIKLIISGKVSDLQVVKGKIANVTTAFGTAPFHQSIELDGVQEHYSYWYNFHSRFLIGDECQFIVLPGTHEILDHRKQ